MENLENWNEVTKGLYRYVIASNVCYEIHIKFHLRNKDIKLSDCSLYISGDWTHYEAGSIFQRDLLYEGTLEECINEAIKDNKENNI